MDYQNRVMVIPLKVLTVFAVGLILARKFGGQDLGWAIVVVATVCCWTVWAAWRGRQGWKATYRGRWEAVPLAVVSAANLWAGLYLSTHRHAVAAATVVWVGACGYYGWMLWRGRHRG